MSTDVIETRPRAVRRLWRAARRDGIRYLAPLGRLLFAGVFVLSALGHFSADRIEYAASHGVPFAAALVPFAGLLAFLGGLSVALGYRTRAGAWLLILYLVPVTFVMHRYWAISDPAAARMEYVQFMKNLSLLGGALLLACFGGGPFSLDAAAAGPPSTPHGRMPPRP